MQIPEERTEALSIPYAGERDGRGGLERGAQKSFSNT